MPHYPKLVLPMVRPGIFCESVVWKVDIVLHQDEKTTLVLPYISFH